MRDRSIFSAKFFCKIYELNTERQNFFCFDSQDYTGVISGSQMGSQLLQNMEIIKQTDALLWKI